MTKDNRTDRRGFLKTSAALGTGVPLALLSGEAIAAESFVHAAPGIVSLPIAGSAMRFPVRRIYCVGLNYRAHREEMGADQRDPPFFFAKHRDMIVQNSSSIKYPTLTKDFHHEIELVVAMKSGGQNIAVADALNHVYGYAVGLDMTRRDLQTIDKQKGWPWESGKSFEQCAPCSAIHPAETVGHFKKGSIQLTVNGQIKQDADLELMIWNVPEIISNLSAQVGLEAGDLIYTGTPAGIGPVVVGDKMVGRIAGLDEIAIMVA